MTNDQRIAELEAQLAAAKGENKSLKARIEMNMTIELKLSNRIDARDKRIAALEAERDKIRAEALERNVAAENAERNLREVLEDMDYETRGSGICSMVDCILREFVFCSQKYKDRLPARAKREKIEGRRILRALGIPSSEEQP